jgi:hypothetical protein
MNVPHEHCHERNSHLCHQTDSDHQLCCVTHDYEQHPTELSDHDHVPHPPAVSARLEYHTDYKSKFHPQTDINRCGFTEIQQTNKMSQHVTVQKSMNAKINSGNNVTS